MFTRLSKLARVSTAAVAGLTASIGLAGSAALIAHPAAAASNVTVNRIAGDQRYETARLINIKKYPNGVPSNQVVLATGKKFPDALAASYLAGQLSAPVMLVTPTTASPAYTGSVVPALTTLLPGSTKNITLVGGPDAIGTDVESDLKTRGYTVSRIAGQSRYDTAQMVDEVGTQAAGTGISGNATAIVATGENFPDALAAGSLAWLKHFPMILTNGTQTALLPQAKDALTHNKIKNVLVMGGSFAVSDAVVADIKAQGITVDKQFAGVDRTDTAAQFLDYIEANYGFSRSEVILASGANFPDALTASAFGGDPKGLLETEPDKSLGTFSTAEFKKVGPFTIDVLGGSFAVPTATSDAAVAAAQTSCGSPKTSNLPELLCASIVSTTQTATSTNDAGTVVQFVLATSLANAKFTPASFKVWPEDDAQNTTGHDGFTAAGICGVNTAQVTCPAASSPNAVNVEFTEGPLQTPSGSTADNASTLTVATVVQGAVTLLSGLVNPDGAAQIGSPGAVTPPSAGSTFAPDVASFSNLRAAADNTKTAIDVKFDKVAFPANSAPTTFEIVLSNNVNNPVAAGSNPREEVCAGPPNTTTALTQPQATPSTPSFDGNGEVTIICPNVSGTTTLTAAQVSYVVVPPGQVATDANKTNPNGFIEASTSPAQQPTAPSPTLTGVTLAAPSSQQPDTATFAFDPNSQTPFLTDSHLKTSLFFLVTQEAASLPATPDPQNPGAGKDVACVASTAPAPTTAPACQTNGSSQATSVTIFLKAGTLASQGVVGGVVAAGAVANANTPTVTNADGELGAQPVSSTVSGQTPGVISAVQLVSDKFQANSSTATANATLTFDESIKFVTSTAQPPVVGGEGLLRWYASDGTELTCAPGSASVGTGTADNTLTCTSFLQNGGSAATATQLAAVTLATVALGAVTGNTAQSANMPANNAFPNPEGSVPA